MSKFKVGDRVKLVGDSYDYYGLKIGTIHPIHRLTAGGVYIKSTDGENEGYFLDEEVELVEEPTVTARVKGTFETLVIESHPQGGYSVIAPGRHWGSEKTTLAAFTTVDEALKFAGENLK